MAAATSRSTPLVSCVLRSAGAAAFSTPLHCGTRVSQIRRTSVCPQQQAMAPVARRTTRRTTRALAAAAESERALSKRRKKTPASQPTVARAAEHVDAAQESTTAPKSSETEAKSWDPEVVYTLPGTLLRCKLLRRYKRFLADVILPDGEEVTVHCPNPGSMRGFGLESCPPVLVSQAPPGSNRKLPYTLEAVLVGESATRGSGTWVGCNTQAPNAAVGEWLRSRSATARSIFGDYVNVRNEVKYGKDMKSRIDFLLEYEDDVSKVGTKGTGKDQTGLRYVEVKNVTMAWDDGNSRIAVFPDSKTVRGQKHLNELVDVIATGKHTACVLYFVSRTDALAFSPCTIDPKYVERFEASRKAGVEPIPLVFGIEFDEEKRQARFVLTRRLALHSRPGPV